MKYDILMFDLDGTLTDPAEGITNSVAHSLRKFGIEPPPAAELYKFIGPPLLESYEKYYGLKGEDGVLAIKYYREHFADVGIFENELYNGIPEMLDRLKKAGKKLYIATSKPEAFAIRIAEHFKIDKYFDCIAGSTLTEKRTKKAEVIAYLGEKEGFLPKDALMIGDREHDVTGAKENGAICVGVLYGYGDRKELEDAGAAYIAKNVDELERLLLSL